MNSWAPGTQVGPYVLLSPLGAGGMGDVWKARDSRLDRLVAVKRLKGPHSERFEQEARAIAALNHPHICQVYDIGPDYLVLEYVEGQRLPCPLPLEEALRLAVQIAGALEAAHRKGIIHRDLKPANIMVTAERNAKLLDFGLAKLLSPPDSDDTRTMEGTILGTVAYMAPEQAEGKSLDERSDVFSFGAVLYEMISGARAFGGSSTAQVLSSVLRDDPPPVRAPAEIGRIVSRCLAKQPGQRFQSMAELRAVLEQVARKPAEPERSIAVLPFSNMSADKENEYFSDGLAEEIINALAQIPDLNVTARTSSFAFRGKEQDIRKIAELLGVRTILEGSVRRAGNRIRITAQLINAASGYHLWSDRYDRELADVFAIQDEIAQAIASALQVKLAPAAKRPAPNLVAYEALLKGRHLVGKMTPESLARGREFLEHAIALDPKSALAYVELANYFIRLAAIAASPAREALPQARAAARQALALDPSLPEAHALLGQVAVFLDFNWQAAGRHFQLAMAHEPVPPHVRYCTGWSYLMPLGRSPEAADQLERALKEDPLNLMCRTHLAVCLWTAGRDAEAAAQFDQVLQMDERCSFALMVRGVWHLNAGELREALVYAEKAYVVSPAVPAIIGMFAAVLLRSGDETRAKSVLEKLGGGQTNGAAIGFAVFHQGCSEMDKAAGWLRQAIEERDPNIFPALCAGPNRKIWQASGHWPELARVLNLPETASGGAAVFG